MASTTSSEDQQTARFSQIKAFLANRGHACLALSTLVLLSCSSPATPVKVAPTQSKTSSSCPDKIVESLPLTGVTDKHLSADYWIARSSKYGDVDAVLFTRSDIERHNRFIHAPSKGQAPPRIDLFMSMPEEELKRELHERLNYVKERIDNGSYLDRRGKKPLAHLQDAARFPAALPPRQEQMRIALEGTPLRCIPINEGLYKAPVDLEFDRNLCSWIRPQELLKIIGPWPNDTLLVRSEYALGWISKDALLSASLTPSQAKQRLAKRARVHASQRLTRRRFLERAFSFLNTPYGWGGYKSGRDCSRLVMDLLGSFGIELPRHSARQAEATTFIVDVDNTANDEKLRLIEAANERGIVLLHFPGHIMLYLGTNDTGTPMVLHAFSEFLSACPNEQRETVHRVDRITVTDLSLGQGSSRRDFLSRITKISVLGTDAGTALHGVARYRDTPTLSLDPAPCRNSKGHSIFVSPKSPNTEQALRIIASSTRASGPGRLSLITPDAQIMQPESQLLSGPPTSTWTEVKQVQAGKWKAVWSDGNHIFACKSFNVRKRAPKISERKEAQAAWPISTRWSYRAENLYATFVEQLFAVPFDDRTWTGLDVLTRNPARNLLYDYRALGEDERVELKPDCADLPYYLRAYFAWKLQLPFTFRDCTRGKTGVAPQCEAEFQSNLLLSEALDDVSAFNHFAKTIASTVHSSSARTLPEDEMSDLYPIKLRRSQIKPGSVFADPYGHLLVVARWVPQFSEKAGALIGADAQPDGTLGRRRFWQGSFLFSPDTSESGAGFKAWRPVFYDKAEATLRVLENSQLQYSKNFPRWSTQQYRGSKEDFYDRMDALINPRALEPLARMKMLVDALEETVARRVVSVQNAEDYIRKHPKEVIPMPRGSHIFQTVGAWEDYSTPSRDMRLLLSIDAVMSFPDKVKNFPDRFGVESEQAQARADEVRAALESSLRERKFRYTRSDQSPQELSLFELVQRQQALELSYNPNDCIEIRWAAPKDSAEAQSCTRRAPEHQTRRMQKYRSWFRTRTRPTTN